MREVDEEAARLEVRIVEHVAVALDRAAWHARLTQQREPVRRGARRRHGLDERDELVAMSLAQRGVGEARIALETLEAERATERGPVRRRRRAKDEVSVGGAYRLIGADELVRRARRARD